MATWKPPHITTVLLAELFFNYEMCIFFLDWILLFLIVLRSPISLAGAV